MLIGPGTAGRLPDEILRWGRRVLVLTGPRGLPRGSARARVVDRLCQAGLQVQTRVIPHLGPGGRAWQEIRRAVQGDGVEAVVGLGGGSVLDGAKMVAALAGRQGEWEDLTQPPSLNSTPLPCVTVPTIAGSGSEVSARVEGRDGHGDPCMLQGIWWLPRTAVLDSLLTHTVPARQTVLSGADAFTRAMECALNPLTSPTASQLAHLAARWLKTYLPTAAARLGDAGAREGVMRASMAVGLAESNASLGVVHAIASILSWRSGVARGSAGLLLLPALLRIDAPTLGNRLVQLSRGLGFSPSHLTSPAHALHRLLDETGQLRVRLRLPSRLRQLKVSRKALPELAREAASLTGSSSYPQPVEAEQVLQLLEEAW